MDYRKISYESEYLTLSGHCLNLKEKTNLKKSLVLLKRDGHFSYLKYWGKILGVKNNYHICQGYTKSLTEPRTTFYSTDSCLSWNQLTSYDPKLTQYLSQIRGFFMGQPSHVYVFDQIKSEDEILAEELEKKKAEELLQQKKLEKENQKSDENEDSDDDQLEEQINVDEDDSDPTDDQKKKKQREIVRICEDVRLQYCVLQIDHDTSVVPRGSVIKNLNEQVVPNLIFQGLSCVNSVKLTQYYHLRNVEGMIKKEIKNKNVDCFDEVSEDVPKKSWSIQYDDFRNCVVGKSLKWPGYVFYCVPEENIWGGYYIGNGGKNLDLCFMV